MSSWFGLTSTADGIHFRAHRHLTRWCWQVELRPDGIACIRRERTDTLRWEDHRHCSNRTELGWWVLPSFSASRSYSVARVALLTTPSTPANPHFAFYDRSWQLDYGWGLNPAGTEILAALCSYLAATPSARIGLGDADRTAALINSLAVHGIRGGFQADPPLMGSRLDLWNTVQRVLDNRVRRISGRTVNGDSIPDLAELVETTQSRLPRHLPPEWKSAERVRPVLERLLTGVEPWPFDCLTTTLGR